MGARQSQATPPPAPIRGKLTAKEFVTYVPFMQANNGPGDDFIGKFAFDWKNKKDRPEIMQRGRYFWYEKKLRAALVDDTLYIIQSKNKLQYTLKISSNDKKMLISKWKAFYRN